MVGLSIGIVAVVVDDHKVLLLLFGICGPVLSFFPRPSIFKTLMCGETWGWVGVLSVGLYISFRAMNIRICPYSGQPGQWAGYIPQSSSLFTSFALRWFRWDAKRSLLHGYRFVMIFTCVIDSLAIRSISRRINALLGKSHMQRSERVLSLKY